MRDTLPAVRDPRASERPHSKAYSTPSARPWQARLFAPAFLLLLTLVYFWPQLVGGRVLYWGDIGLYFTPMAGFLRENLRLRLLGARLSLLSRDERAFKADLQAASGWLKQYFDLKAKPVQSALNMLSQQSAVTMRGAMPDLSRSLEAVRALRAVTERLPDHPAERLPAQPSAHPSASTPARAR